MKKIFLTLLIICSFCFGAVANEVTTDTVSINVANTANSSTDISEDFFDILPNMVGAALVVYVADIDTVIRGRLQKVYTDGIVVKTAFSQTIFISRKSISYFEIKDANAYDF
jgi:hypothetical protein